ncbi:MAG: hypothetical protein KDA44_19460 [Planctomycetales bacterium]|nr:hypothetical protein [Planctomycetales bacterium]
MTKSLAEALMQRGDLKLRNSSIEAALFTISEIWGVNVVTGKGVQGAVNCDFKNAALREVLDSILLANGYSYRPVGESLVVQATGEVGSANPLFSSTTLPIRFGDLDEIADGAKMLASSQGQIHSLGSARSLLVVDYEDRVKSIAAFVQRMEEAASNNSGGQPVSTANQLEVVYFHTQYIPAENARPALQAVLSGQGRVAVMPTENRLLVVDMPRNIAMARKVLDRVDRPRPQVRITAFIYDLSLQDVEQLGLNWGGGGKGNELESDGRASHALEFDTMTLAPFNAGAAGGAFTVRSLARNFDINTVLQMLQTANDARLLADPNVTVLDNEQATMKSVSEIPYQQITQSELGGQIGTTAFKEAGITLRVLPTIAADGTIEMLVEPEYSRLAGFTPKENQPIIDTRTTVTRVRVTNRQTIVISGLRQRSDTGEFNGIPWLKDIKYVGPLFRSRDTNVRESELIVFLTPEVVGYDVVSSPRDFQAQETVTCRLDRIPMAEGCQDGACNPGGCADTSVIPLPPVDPETAPAPMPAVGGPTLSPLRPHYDNRYRATGELDARRQGLVPPSPTRSTKKKSSWSLPFWK